MTHAATAAGAGELGAPCAGDVSCVQPLACQDGTCVKLVRKRLGEYCATDELCGEGLFCADHACASGTIVGRPCQADGDCSIAFNLVCQHGHCEIPGPDCTPDEAR